MVSNYGCYLIIINIDVFCSKQKDWDGVGQSNKKSKKNNEDWIVKIKSSIWIVDSLSRS